MLVLVAVTFLSLKNNLPIVSDKQEKKYLYKLIVQSAVCTADCTINLHDESDSSFQLSLIFKLYLMRGFTISYTLW